MSSPPAALALPPGVRPGELPVSVGAVEVRDALVVDPGATGVLCADGGVKPPGPQAVLPLPGHGQESPKDTDTLALLFDREQRRGALADQLFGYRTQ